MRNLYYDGVIPDKYRYNIHNYTITFLIEYLQQYHSEIESIQDINVDILKDFLKHMCKNGTQRSFLTVHKDVVNMEFNVNITTKDLRENKSAHKILTN
jgi:hypothetical protein